VRLRGCAGGGQITGLWIDPKHRDRRPAALANIEHIAPVTDCHDRRASGGLPARVLREPAGLVDGEDSDLVRIL